MRKTILTLLQENSETFLSGEAISKQLQLTRAAVWKQIQLLKESGYVIEAQTRKGYRLMSGPQDLDDWAISSQLATKVLGNSIKLFDELPSTNDLAKELVRQGIPNGTVIIARCQSRGRGRLQRVWVSPKGGLWLSVILKPNLELAEAAKLTLSAGVAVANVCQKLYGLEARIKWPNDVVVGGQKLAGILGEVVGEWNTVQTIILGIGINGNFTRENLDPELPATTLLEQLQQKVDLNRLAAELLNELEEEVNRLENNDTQGLRERWLAKAAGIGTTVSLERSGECWTGTFKGIKDNGELILEVAGKEMCFSSGDVRMRPAEAIVPSKQKRGKTELDDRNRLM